MSERGSFTSQYIYNDKDYEAVRSALDLKKKYLCICPQASWKNEQGTEFKMPIVAGKIGELTSGMECFVLADALTSVKVEEVVKFVVLCDNGDIDLVTLYPSGHPEGRVSITAMLPYQEELGWWL